VASPPDVSELEAELRESKAHSARLERELEALGRELERVKRSNSWRVTEPLRAAKAKLGARR
jgi:hypothetical protein